MLFVAVCFCDPQVFKQLSDSEVILAVVTKKARPTFPSDCPSKCVRVKHGILLGPIVVTHSCTAR